MPRHQPRLKQGRRDRLGSAVEHRIWSAVWLEAARYDCARSYVVATILGKHFGILEQADYAEGVRPRLVRRRKSA